MNPHDLVAVLGQVESPLTVPASGYALETQISTAMPVKLSVLMAAYNEATTITVAVHGILDAAHSYELELIVVDDGSTDGTWELLQGISDDRLKLHRHDRNSGKGSAITAALAVATGSHIVPFDADMEYDPDDIPRMMVPVLKGRSDVVYGARLFGYNTVYQNYRYAVGNRVLTRLANVLFDAHISDLHTCLKLIPLAMIRELPLKERGFGLDTEITALLLRQGVRPFEVPVSYYSRPRSRGKKITWRDGAACMWILLRVRLRRGIPRVSVSEAGSLQTTVSEDSGESSSDAPRVISASV